MNLNGCPEGCTRCSGEYCERHFDQPCDCDVVERHSSPAPAPRENQCDGCNLGLPVDKRGTHYHPDKEGWERNHMSCTKDKYAPREEEA